MKNIFKAVVRIAANVCFTLAPLMIAEFDVVSDRIWLIVGAAFVVSGFYKANFIDDKVTDTICDLLTDAGCSVALFFFLLWKRGMGLWVADEIGGFALSMLLYVALILMLLACKKLPDGGMWLVSVYVIGSNGMVACGIPWAAAISFMALVTIASSLLYYWDAIHGTGQAA